MSTIGVKAIKYPDGDSAINITDGGNVTLAGTLGVTGAITGTLATAAQPNVNSLGTLSTLTVDDITINGSTISDAGDFTLDIGGDITLDADGQQIYLKNNGTHWGTLLTNGTPQHFYIDATISDGDIIFRGNDGGSTINALTLDMSAAGNATFNGTVRASNGTNSLPSLSFSGDTNTGLYRPAADNLGFAVGGVARAFMSGTQFSMTGNGRFSGTIIAESGNITISDGNLVVASGHGIDFGATANNTAQSSSMGSELLDDYEEGTWTPSYSVTTTAGDLGYHSPHGSYIKIGNQVTVWFYMNAYENNASGDFRVNLPFTSQNVSNYFAVASLTGTGWTGIGDAQEIHGRLSANATIINLMRVGNMNEAGAVTQANTDTSFLLYGTITYKTA